MRINKIFHYLYLIIMFLPFMAFFYNFAGNLLSQSGVNNLTYQNIYDMFLFPTYVSGGVCSSIYNAVYNTLCINSFGLSGLLVQLLSNLLVYWLIMSIIWLVFDIFMYLPLVIHNLIDKAMGGLK